MLECPGLHPPSLFSTVYSSQRLVCDEKEEGIYRYRCWLPVSNQLAGAGRPLTYKSERLSSVLGLPNLWITFSGYWPERGATLETATFKELEAYGVLSRIRMCGSQVLVVASAGNTAAAFARVCSENDIRCLIVVPASGMRNMQLARRLGSSVKIVSLTANADYSDAIAFAYAISHREGFLWEGGAQNVGRRDGAGTAMLNAVEAIGALPDYYFQAIGSGVGAIAAHEAAKRLVHDSRLNRTLPRLMLSQNLPFAPVFDSWRRGRRELIEIDRGGARVCTREIVATVLSNQRPPYTVGGGIFDALRESRGDMFAVGNDDVRRSMRLFEGCEDIDIDPAAGVALAALSETVRTNQINPAATVLLHITGGGYCKRASRRKLMTALPNLEIPLRELCTEAAVTNACDLF
jgi:cysteate synthase